MAAVDRGFDQVFLRLAQLSARMLHQFDAAAPGQHHEGDDGGEQQRKPAALEQFDLIGGEENAVDGEEESVDRDHDEFESLINSCDEWHARRHGAASVQYSWHV